jgi:multisubunit Na+/H+ antiporter MnhB subunit
MPLMLVFSLLLLFRGHNLPGGGFAGGLTAALTFAFYAIAYGVPRARKALRVPPAWLIAGGLLVAGSSGALGFLDGAWLAGIWPGLRIEGVGELGSPLLFDAGVYLTVTGAIVSVFFEVAE